jgi:uncharacterized protein YbjT (DUF2867 family)
MKALLIGSTGLIGTHCLNELLLDKEYSDIEIWVRNKTDNSNQRLTEKLINFDKISEIQLTDADHVFCCLGTTINKVKTKEAFVKIDRDYVTELAKLAERSVCKKFIVVSSIGAYLKSRNFYLRTKGEMEEALKKLSIPAIYIFRPSMLLGKRNEFRFGEQLGKAFMFGFQFLFIGKLRKYRGIHAFNVAHAMVMMAKSDQKGVFIIESDQIEKISKN